MRISIVVAACLIASAAGAQQPPPCGPWEAIQKSLKDKYQERPIGGGVVNADTVVSVLSSLDGKTFTILSVTKDGRACFIASGSDWDPGVNPAVEG